MGCGVSAPEDPMQNLQNPNLNEIFWPAGSVQGGVKGVPAVGPFGPESVPPQAAKHKILFAETEIGKEIVDDYVGVAEFTGSSNIYTRAFFPHCLPGYAVGWSKLELSSQHPHYNSKKHREREKEKERLGMPIDHSKKKKYHLYPERVSEVALTLQVGSTKHETETAVSSTTWPARPLPKAFFTFSPAGGTVFGENSLSIPLRLAEDDPLLEDKRWVKLNLELNRVLSKLRTGKHNVQFALKFRYGNTKFSAWRGAEGESKDANANAKLAGSGWRGEAERGVFRFSDENRAESAISEVVASGGFTIKISSEESQALKKSIPVLEARYAAVLKKEEEGKG